VTLIVILGAASSALAANRAWHSYTDFCRRLYFDKFYATAPSERDHVMVGFTAQRDDGDLTPVVFVIDSRPQPVTVRADVHGVYSLPVTPELLAEDPQILVDLPPAVKLAVSLELRPAPIGSTHLSYADLMKSVAQTNALIKRQAGRLSIFAPRMKTLTLKFASSSPQQLSIASASGAMVLSTNDNGEITVPFDQALYTADPPVVITAIRESVDFGE
jgi:hypothetical protein